MSSSNIKDLEVYDPLGILQAQNISKYVDVSSYKKIGIAFFSDIPLNLTFTFSHNSKRDGPKHIFTTNPGLWETSFIPIILPYIKLDYEKVNKVSNQSNDELIVVCTGFYKRGFSFEEHPKVLDSSSSSSEGSKTTEKVEKRRWSSILSKSPTKLEKIENTDSRIPDLILPNCLFIGAKGNKIITLPPGQIGQSLQMTETGIKWI